MTLGPFVHSSAVAESWALQTPGAWQARQTWQILLPAYQVWVKHGFLQLQIYLVYFVNRNIEVECCFFSLLTLKNIMLSLQTAAAETVHDSLWLVLNAK